MTSRQRESYVFMIGIIITLIVYCVPVHSATVTIRNGYVIIPYREGLLIPVGTTIDFDASLEGTYYKNARYNMTMIGWVTDGDKVQWDNRSVDTEDFTYFIHPLWPGMDTTPDCTQSNSGYGQQQVLGRSRAVLDPEA